MSEKIMMSVSLVNEYKTKLCKLNQMIDNYHYDYQPRTFCAMTNTYVHSEECTCEYKQACLRHQVNTLRCIFRFDGIKPLVDSKAQGVLKEFGVAIMKEGDGEKFDTLWKALEFAKKMKEAMETDVKEGREIFLKNEVLVKKAVYAADAVLKKLVEKDIVEGEYFIFDEAKWSVVDVHLEKELKNALQRVEALRQARKNAIMWSAMSTSVAKVDEMLGYARRNDAKRVKLEHRLD
jgi:hypothetical protein